MWYTGLKELRLAVKMPSKELAEKIGKDATYISRIENGYILNTSYDIVSSMARVIADTDAVINREVDLYSYNSEFARLVMSYRIDDMKEVYDFSKDNKELEDFAFLMKYLKKEDMETFMTLAKYRNSEKLFEEQKQMFIEAVIKESRAKNIKELLKRLNKNDEYIKFDFSIDFEEIVEEKFEVIIDNIAQGIYDKYRCLEMMGIESVIFENYEKYEQYGSNLEDEGEIIIPEPQ